MCELFFTGFKMGYADLRDAFVSNPNRELLIESRGQTFKIRFDESRLNEVVTRYKPMVHQGHACLPVLVDEKIRHVLAYHSKKEIWFLTCGKKHFPWCHLSRYRAN